VVHHKRCFKYSWLSISPKESMMKICRETMERVVQEGNHKSHKALNAFELLKYDQDRTMEYENVLSVFRISAGKIDCCLRFVEEGFKTASTPGNLYGNAGKERCFSMASSTSTTTIQRSIDTIPIRMPV